MSTSDTGTGASKGSGGRAGLVVGWIVSIVTAAVAVAGICLTWPQLKQVEKNLDLTRESQITDRFNDAVNNIGSDKLGVRLGGILALQRIMDDSKRDQPSIIYVLSGFIRDTSTDPSRAKPASISMDHDIQAAFEVLAARESNHDKSAQINLSYAEMTKVNADHAVLISANLEGVDWRQANLPWADLRESNLSKADLSEASFEIADLSQAVLRDAKLNGASFRQAEMEKADLRDADLTNADFSEADLHGSDIYPAKMPGADLSEADLRSLDLSDADLSGADLSDADLRGADLDHANLSGAILDGAQLDPEDRHLLGTQ